jgi:hypothetical protein
MAAGNRVHSQLGRPALDGRQLQRADVALHPDPAAGMPGENAAGTHSCMLMSGTFSWAALLKCFAYAPSGNVR